jgi:hypothetical protein
MSNTLYKSLEVVYNSFKYLLTNAQHVVMLQDGITENNVQFYTSFVGIEALDRRYVHGCCFQKPVEIHPIKMTLDFHPAVVNMLKCYKNSIQPGGACLHPFMVFCNSAVLAEFFCRLLRTTATQCNADTKRIKGIWSQIKHTDDFCKRFAREPNTAALDADVIVCTSVIGAGFSINRHFESFHAFFVVIF